MVTVSIRPFEAKIILFEFLLSEVGKMSCSVHGSALKSITSVQKVQNHFVRWFKSDEEVG